MKWWKKVGSMAGLFLTGVFKGYVFPLVCVRYRKMKLTSSCSSVLLNFSFEVEGSLLVSQKYLKLYAVTFNAKIRGLKRCFHLLLHTLGSHSVDFKRDNREIKLHVLTAIFRVLLVLFTLSLIIE